MAVPRRPIGYQLFWSDGTVITAHDFVYSWRRVVDPETATPQYGFYLFGVRNAEEINAGKTLAGNARCSSARRFYISGRSGIARFLFPATDMVREFWP